jgi:hypothetical protein
VWNCNLQTLRQLDNVTVGLVYLYWRELIFLSLIKFRIKYVFDPSKYTNFYFCPLNIGIFRGTKNIFKQLVLLLPCPITLGVADCNFTPLSTLANRYYYQHKPSQRRLLESKHVVWWLALLVCIFPLIFVLNLFLQYKTISLLWFYGFYHLFSGHYSKFRGEQKNLLMRNTKQIWSSSEIDGMFTSFQKFMQWLIFYYGNYNYHFPCWGILFGSLQFKCESCR